MAFEKARSALLNITERFRKGLGAAGEIPLELQPTLQPVIIAADLRQGGNSPYRGRRWSFAPAGGNMPAGFGFTMQFQAAVVIERIWFQISAAGLGCSEVWHLDSGSPATATATQVGHWIDDETDPNDRPPILANSEVFANLIAETAPTSRQMLYCQPQGGASTCFDNLEIMLRQGSFVIARTQTTITNGAAAFGIQGRIY